MAGFFKRRMHNMDSRSTLEEARGFKLETGFQFPEKRVEIDPAEQNRLHGWCDIGPDVFGDVGDPALIGRLPVVMLSNTIVAQRPGWGQVHVVQRIQQRRAIGLGESLRLTGEIKKLIQHPRGELATTVWRYWDELGQTPFEVVAEGLLLDPNPVSRDSEPKQNVEPESREFERVLSKQCTPQATVGYCDGTNNLIHSDVEVARQLGFRAPIIAGTQTMSFLLEPLYQAEPPGKLSLTIRFRRPVFWDDVVDIEVAKNDIHIEHVRAMNSANKCVADCSVVSG
jgi:acyl dehydratase